MNHINKGINTHHTFNAAYGIVLWLAAMFILIFPHEMSGSHKHKGEDDWQRMNPAQMMRSYAKRAERFGDANADSAIFYYDIATTLYDPAMGTEASEVCASIYLKKANLLYSHFSYSRAMEAILKCRRICEDNSLGNLMADATCLVGNIFSQHYDYGRAIPFYKQFLNIADSLCDSNMRHKALNNLIGANAFSGNLKDAEIYYDQMRRNPIKDKAYRYDLLMDGGIIAVNSGAPERSLRLFKQACAYADSNAMNVASRGAAVHWVSQSFRQLKNLDSTLYYLKKNEVFAMKHNQNDLLVETYKHLSDIYRETGNKQLYLSYLEKYFELSDKVFNQSMFNSLKNMQFEYELDKNSRVVEMISKEYADKKQRIKKMWMIVIFVSVVLTVTLVAMVLVMKQKKKLKESYLDLYRKNKSNLENEKLYNIRIRDLEESLEALNSKDRDDSGDVLAGKIESGGNVTDNAPEIDDDNVKKSIALQSQLKLVKAITAFFEKTDAYCNHDFSIKMLADSIGSNTSYVSKAINEYFGMNFRSFLSEYRIKESMKRMEPDSEWTNFTIKAIAESVGFKSQSAFILAFTRYTGMKPNIYQQMAKRGEIGIFLPVSK